jgi:hypothetical protein
VVNPFASRHVGPGFNPQGRYLCETRILLLALSRNKTLHSHTHSGLARWVNSVADTLQNRVNAIAGQKIVKALKS